MKLRDLFKPISADQKAVQQLEEMKRSLLDVQAQKEWFTAQERALQTGIERLTKHVQSINTQEGES